MLVVLLLTLGVGGLEAADLPDGYTYPRQVVQMLTVGNGHSWGQWERMEFCPMGTYASGFEIKVTTINFISNIQHIKK